MRKIIDSPEVKAKHAQRRLRGVLQLAEELDDFIKVQLGKWGKMIKDAGIQPE